jgi:hypothetical protein
MDVGDSDRGSVGKRMKRTRLIGWLDVCREGKKLIAACVGMKRVAVNYGSQTRHVGLTESSARCRGLCRVEDGLGLIRLQDIAAAQRVELAVTGKGSSSGGEW